MTKLMKFAASYDINCYDGDGSMMKLCALTCLLLPLVRNDFRKSTPSLLAFVCGTHTWFVENDVIVCRRATSEALVIKRLKMKRKNLLKKNTFKKICLLKSWALLLILFFSFFFTLNREEWRKKAASYYNYIKIN